MRTPQGGVRRQGSRWIARISWGRANGAVGFKRSEVVASKNAGLDLVNRWRREILDTGTTKRADTQARDGDAAERHTFNDLSDFYRDRYAVDAVYRDEKKISGQKSWKTTRGHIKLLRAELGDVWLDALDWNNLDEMRAALMVKYSVAYTNRVMSTCRRMLKIARQKKWMKHNPFEEGDPLIQRAHEVERTRILTHAEELILLSKCTKESKRDHLRAIIITAIETGMRQGEMMKLERDQIDWKAGVLRVKARHTKTEEERIVPITARLRKELFAWVSQRPPLARSVFGVSSNVDTAFRGAKTDAGMAEVRFHDLRHTFGTRAIQKGVPLAMVAKVMGHRSIQTTMRYINVDVNVARDLAKKMDRRIPAKKGRDNAVSVN